MKADGGKLHRGIRRCLTLALFCAAVTAIVPLGRAQTDYLMEVGSPSFAVPETVEQGFVNVANGNLHLEIPLTSTPQRGSIPFKANLIYDSRIWRIVNNAWQPTNVPGPMGGWRFMTTADPGAVTYGTTRQTQGCSGQTYYEVYSPFYWRAADGTQHVFPVSTQRDFGCGASSISNGSGFAEDSTGYKITISNYTQATVQSNDGSQVYPSVKDSNGNYYTADVNGNLIDTLNRTSVTATVNGDLIYYDILNSQGSTSRYTVTTSTINVSTGFGVPGVTEYTGTVTVVQSIAVPDGTSFGFTYDSGYGLLQGMTLPTGGSIGYAFTTYQDSYGNMNRWLTSRTAGSGTWTYLPEVVTTCPPGTVGCQQKTIVTKPSGDRTAYIFTLNNGAWNVETDVYNGPSTLLKTVTTDYDFSNPCPQCVGSIYVRPVRKTTVDVGTVPLTRKIEWTYDSPQYGNVTSVKEWGYYTGAPPATPEREIDFTYLSSSSYVNKNIISRVTNLLVKNGGGTKFSETAYGYDSTSLTLVSGITHHDDPGYGTGNTVRGNPTLIRRWVSGSTYRSTTLYYDTTGQATKITNAKGNNTLFSYSDRFFTDNGANPPQTYTPASPTNAYVTQVTLPITGSVFFGYYFNTGKIACAIDQNGADDYTHYLDPLDRQSHHYGPSVNANRGWVLNQYSTATLVDIYTGLNTPSPSPSCTECRHDQVHLDGLGRVVSQVLASDPEGADYTDTVYDSSGRHLSVSNPYRDIMEPSYGVETLSYDGLDRVTTRTRADGNSFTTYYGAAVVSVGGNASQLCPSGTYGVGFPMLWIDEAGNKRQAWQDGLGRTIEVDEPDPNNGNSLTLCTCYTRDVLDSLKQVAQGIQTRTYSYDGLSRLISATNPESGTTTYAYQGSRGALCAGNPRMPCSRTDARGITTTYTYDALDRLTKRDYTGQTPDVYYYYDESSVTVNQIDYPLTNTLGRLSHTKTTNGSQPVMTIQSYDAAGRVVALWQCEVQGCTMRASQYSYNLAGDLASWVNPKGYTVTNTFNNAQNLVAVSSNKTGSPLTIATFAYTPFGRANQIIHGCQQPCTPQVQQIDYNNRLQVTRMQFGPSGQPPSNYCYVYNYYTDQPVPSACEVPPAGSGNNGSVRSVLDISPPLCSVPGCYGWYDISNTASFSYDSLNRLTSAVAFHWGPPSPPGSPQLYMNMSYSYDRYGNMSCSGVYTNGSCSPKTFNTSTNRIALIGGSLVPTYDNAGNLTSDGVNTYESDPEGRLVEATISSVTATYVYNGLNQLVLTEMGYGQQVDFDDEYVYDPAGDVIGLYDNHGGYDVEPISNDAAPSPYAMYTDVGGGSAYPTAMPRDALGSTTQEGLGNSYYDPFGKPIFCCPQYGALYLNFARFTSSGSSLCSDLHPSPCGAHNASQGRLMNPNSDFDPLDPQSLNGYSYAGNNPTSPGQGKAPLGDRASPWQVGWEWLRGDGPRQHTFTDGDPFAEMLRQHPHIQKLIDDICSGKAKKQGEAPYDLSGLEGIPKYFRDYSTVLTLGATGNLAVTYLGSYSLKYSVSNGTLNIKVSNESTISSATHWPYFGYSDWWKNNIGEPLDAWFSSGRMSKTSQTFNLHENLKERCKCRK